MNNVIKNSAVTLLAVQTAILIALAPLGASAHFINTDIPYEYMAAVASDGHDHEHAPAPVVASDGHTDHTHEEGASELIKPFSSRWWGLLGVSTLLTIALSFGVIKYLHVPPVLSNKEKASADKPVTP